MTAQQQRIGEAFRAHGAYHRSQNDFGGLGDARPITQAIGAGLLSAGGIIAAIPGGQLPGAIVAAVGALTSLVGGLFVPNITNIQATRIVDDIELRVLKPTLASWQALPANQKTEAMRAAHLMVIDKALSDVMAGCSNPQLGDSGRRCISERVRGGRFPWPEWYRDPIANDPNVSPDAASGVLGGLSSTFGVSPMLVGIGLIGLAFVAVSD